MANTEMSFMQKLQKRWDQGHLVCVGLDSAYGSLPPSVKRGKSPESAVCMFNEYIVNATASAVCAYKPNIAFYPNSEHRDTRYALQMSIEHVHRLPENIPIILDAKRGDIGNSNLGYVAEALEEFNADAVTLNPYMGGESLEPFFEHPNLGCIFICRTSNPGAREFQTQKYFFESLGELLDNLNAPVPESELLLDEWKLANGGFAVPAYQYVALRAAYVWNKHSNIALVVGATAPEELAQVRKLVGNMPILVPGIGAQGGSLEEVLKAGLTSRGDGLIINASRSIIFAGNDENYAEAARAELDRMNDIIAAARSS